MAKIKFDEQDYVFDKEGFLDGFLVLLEAFFGKEQVSQFAMFASLEGANNIPKTNLENTLDAVPEFVLKGKWDLKNGTLYDLGFCLEACEALLDASNIFVKGPLTGELELIIRAARARVKIHDFGSENFDYLTLEDLALLADMSVASVKNAQYAKNDDRLIVSDDGRVTAEDARRWLKGRRHFKPTYFYDSKFATLEQVKELKTIIEVRNMLQWRGQAMQVTAKQIADAFDGAISVEVAENEFCREYRVERFDQPRDPIDLAEMLTPSICINLAKLLDIDPIWFVKTATKLAAENLAERLVQNAVKNANQVLNEKGLSSDAVSQTPVAPEEIATAGTIRQLLVNTPGLSQHPKFKKGNTKIEAYLLDNERAIAHEYNLRNQALWVRSDGISDELLEINHETDRALHSGLLKYPELAKGHLFKFFPRSMAEVVKIVEAILSAEQISHDSVEDTQ